MVTETAYVRPHTVGSTSATSLTTDYGIISPGSYEMALFVSSQVPGYMLAKPTDGSLWLSTIRLPLHQLRSQAYQLIQPIWIQIESYSNGYLVTDQDVNRHGVGSTIEDAIRDHEDILISYYESLQSRRDRLSTRLQRHLANLNRMLAPI